MHIKFLFNESGFGSHTGFYARLRVTRDLSVITVKFFHPA